MRGTDIGGVAPALPLPGLHSDEHNAEDLLGITGEVETLAALVTASSTEAPLAIGLLGIGHGQVELHAPDGARGRRAGERSANNLSRGAFVANVAHVIGNMYAS